MSNHNHVFGTTAYDAKYWDDYLEARPTYDAVHYASVFEYHAAHAVPTLAPWSLAHDLGTGPGQVAAELATRFARVVASDKNPTHLEAARHRLGALLDGKVELAQVAGEDLAEHYPAGEADMVVAAECMPLIDAKRGVAAWAKLLKPGGTLAIWFYGRPAFADPAAAKTCEPLLAHILDFCFERAIKAAGERGARAWKSAADRMESWLDDVHLPAQSFKDVRRLKWNTDKAMSFYGPNAYHWQLERSSNVAETEDVIEKQDRAKWAKDWDIGGVKQFVRANNPAISDEQELEELTADMYKKLETAMGGPGAKQKICWPVVLILATKK